MLSFSVDDVESIELAPTGKARIYIHTHTHIYMCVCVCVCVYSSILLKKHKGQEHEMKGIKSKKNMR